MPRKETITRDYLIETAITLAKQEGVENVTARKLAAKAGCSTQPIFRVYKNMSELQTAVYDKSVQFFRDYYAAFDRVGKVPFTNLGMAYIAFARKEKNLFRLLFVDNGSDIESLGNSVKKRINNKDVYIQYTKTQYIVALYNIDQQKMDKFADEIKLECPNVEIQRLS